MSMLMSKDAMLAYNTVSLHFFHTILSSVQTMQGNTYVHVTVKRCNVSLQYSIIAYSTYSVS